MNPCVGGTGGGRAAQMRSKRSEVEMYHNEEFLARIEPDDEMQRAIFKRSVPTDDNTFQVMSEKVGRLKRRVRELRELYVSERFRDDQIVEDFERIGLRIDGMPTVHQVTALSLANIDLVQTIHTSFENLARVAVFIDQARLGEVLSTTDHVSFHTHFERLENDNEHGVYWLLCALYRLILELPHPRLDPDVVRSVQSIRVSEVDSNSVRHTRDYLVLRDMERMLEQMGVDFGAIHMMNTASGTLNE